MVGFVGLLLLVLLYIRYVVDGNSWFPILLVVILAVATIAFTYTVLTTHLKRRYIVVDEDKISIPEEWSFSYDHVFSYERITHLEVVEKWSRHHTTVWIYIESGKHRKAKIFTSMLESEAVFLEIYNAVKDKVNPDSCNVPPPRFRLF